MTFKRSVIACAILFGLATISSIGAAATPKIGDYDFSYLSSGDPRVKPLQVFDNGKETWFQFRADGPTPVIFGTREGKQEVLPAIVEGPYIKVAYVGSKFLFAFDKIQATVVYGGVGRAETPVITVVASNGMKTPYTGVYPTDAGKRLETTMGTSAPAPVSDLQVNSYATPTKGDRVVWKETEVETTDYPIYFEQGSVSLSPAAKKAIALLLSAAKSATSVTVVGRDDPSLKEFIDTNRAATMRSALIAGGVSEDKILIKSAPKGTAKGRMWPSDIRIEQAVSTPVSRAPQPVAVKAPVEFGSESPVGGFAFKASDQRVSGTVRRWAAATNYQVVWEAPIDADAPVTGDATLYASSVKDAITKVMAGLQKKGYDLQATFYSNRVIRFTGASK